jgi:hypothetical protein
MRKAFKAFAENKVGPTARTVQPTFTICLSLSSVRPANLRKVGASSFGFHFSPERVLLVFALINLGSS